MTTYRITDRESNLSRTTTDYDARDAILDLIPVDGDTSADVVRVIEDLTAAISRGDWQAIYGAADYLDLDVDVESDDAHAMGEARGEGEVIDLVDIVFDDAASRDAVMRAILQGAGRPQEPAGTADDDTEATR